MLRKATQDDLPALVALRCKAARTNRTDAAGWLQNVAGLENILLLVKSGAPPAAMLAAVLGLPQAPLRALTIISSASGAQGVVAALSR